MGLDKRPVRFLYGWKSMDMLQKLLGNTGRHYHLPYHKQNSITSGDLNSTAAAVY